MLILSHSASVIKNVKTLLMTFLGVRLLMIQHSAVSGSVWCFFGKANRLLRCSQPHERIIYLSGLSLNCSNFGYRKSWSWTGLVSTRFLSCGALENVGQNNTDYSHTWVFPLPQNDLPSCSSTDIYFVNNAASWSLHTRQQHTLRSNLGNRNMLSLHTLRLDTSAVICWSVVVYM